MSSRKVTDNGVVGVAYFYVSTRLSLSQRSPQIIEPGANARTRTIQ